MSEQSNTHEFCAEVQTFWIAHGEGVLHRGVLQPGERVATGLPALETFSKRRPWMARIIELGGGFES